MPVSAREDEKARTSRVGRMVLLSVIAAFDVFALILALTAYRDWRTLQRLDFGQIALAVGIGVIAALVSFTWLRRILARSVYETLDLILAGEALPLNGAQPVTVNLRVKRDLSIKAVTLRLIKEEYTVNRAGTRDTTYTERFTVEEKALAVPALLTPMQPLSLAETLLVPLDAPPTMRTPNTALSWHVELSLKIRHWPDTKLSCEFKVLPEVAVNEW